MKCKLMVLATLFVSSLAISENVSEQYLFYHSISDPSVLWGNTSSWQTFKTVDALNLTQIQADLWGATGTGTLIIREGQTLDGTQVGTATTSLINGVNTWTLSNVSLKAGTWYTAYISTDTGNFGIPVADNTNMSLNSSYTPASGYYGPNSGLVTNNFKVSGSAVGSRLWQDNVESISWSSWNASVVTVEKDATIVHSGTMAEKITFSDSVTDWGTWSRSVNNADWTDAETMSVWVYRTSDFVDGGLLFDIQNSDGGYVNVGIITNANTMLNEWTQVEFALTDQVRNDIINMRMYSHTTWTPGAVVYLDDFAVTIPEPATMAIIGVGSLLVLVKRRKK